jgi:hypothetical protein
VSAVAEPPADDAKSSAYRAGDDPEYREALNAFVVVWDVPARNVVNFRGAQR